MSRLINDLYNGRMCPRSRYDPILNHSKENKEEAFQGYTALLRKLDKEQGKELQKMMDRYLENIPLMMEQSFSDGFKTGMKIMCEVFMQGKKADRVFSAVHTEEPEVNVQRDIIELLQWIAENERLWLQICEGESLSTDEILYLVECMEEKKFIQLIPVILTRNYGDIGVDEMITTLSLKRMAESWTGKSYESIIGQLNDTLAKCCHHESGEETNV